MRCSAYPCMKRFKRQFRFLASICLFVILTACGGGRDDSARGTSQQAPIASDTVDAFIAKDCVDISPPSIIEVSGCYRLAGDYHALLDGDFGITIFASHVKLDLSGHTLAGSGPQSTAVGIHAIGTQRITIQNGVLKDFLYGIRIDPSSVQAVTETTIRNVNVAQGSARGISVTAESVTIEDSQIFRLSGYTGWPASHTIGIEVFAANCAINNNHIVDYLPEGVGEAVGISLSSPVENCTLSGNRIETIEPPKFGRTIGIWVTGEQISREPRSLSITQNIVTGADYAFMSPQTPKIEHNRFTVGCTPSDVTTYDKHIENNNFNTDGTGCRDTIEYLEPLTELNSNWKIRLAAALIERQQSNNVDGSSACDDYTRAKTILTSLVDEKFAGAAEQMSRTEQLIRTECS